MKVISRPEVLCFIPGGGGCFNHETCTFDDVQKHCTSTVTISPDPLPPTASTSLSMKIPENSNDPVPADEGGIQMQYYSD